MSQLDLAAGKSVTIKNEALVSSISVLTRKIVIIGVADATLLAGDLVENEPIRVFNAGAVGLLAGKGTMIHRLAQYSMKESGGIETWIIPQAEGGTDVAATGDITITASSVKSGTIYFYVSGDSDNVISVNVANGADEDAIASSLADAINAKTDLPITAVASLGVVTCTAKSKGTYGNFITLIDGLNGEVLPSGVSMAYGVPSMAGGVGVADISPALSALGEGDETNSKYFTALIHGYGADTVTLDAISNYVGEGNEFEGCFDGLIGRPFRSKVGDVDNDLATTISFTDNRKLDRANGMISIPNSQNHPAEFAAQALSIMEFKNRSVAQADYSEIVLDGVFSGDTRWSSEYSNRNDAVLAGISTTTVKNGAVCLQDMQTFYRPETIDVKNNAYRRDRDISIIQNMFNAWHTILASEEWTNFNVVKDISRVRDPEVKKISKDIQSVKNLILSVGNKFVELGWIYSIDAVVDGLKDENAVTVIEGGGGFKFKTQYFLSGSGTRMDTGILVDTNFTVGG